MCVCVAVSSSAGLPAEGLLHRHTGPAVPHGGGLLEDDVGLELSLNRHADGAEGERTGSTILQKVSIYTPVYN